ncbi:syntaxin of plants [Klebsormidium nitens]|uniref:Syntaxin of plants n=1 Tax=Klebsormidium nitens TaxID=105231 RepID=A0A1Y1HGF9_KLENI|nr:syntaxin of plants [Klebsormidium nitens]|eukprot:GAQ77640.1 syntaxin of plants [Klebsormidium nitens]
MATRNRTVAFLKYREAVRQSKPAFSATIEMSSLTASKGRSGYDTISTTDADGSRGSVGHALPPAWVDVSEEVATEIGKLRLKMAELSKIHSRALMPTFDDSGGTDQTIEIVTQEVTRGFKKCEQKLRRLEAEKGAKGQDASIRKNVQRALATDLQAISLDFRKQQKAYLQKLQAQQDGASSSLGTALDRPREDEDESYDPGFTEVQLQRIKNSEALAAERDKEVQQILESVNELAQIMRDLSTLVIDQGTIVDRIDYNIEQVATSINAGVKELEKAEKTQKAGRMVLCVMILILMVLFMLVVLVLKHLFF